MLLLSDIFPELQRVYSRLNKELFENKLPKNIEFVWDSAERLPIRYIRKRGVLKLGTSISKLSSDQFLDALLHQMIHIHHGSLGVKDCNQQQYHNKNFLNKALDIGLCVTRHSSRGYAITVSNPSENLGKVKYPKKEIHNNLNKVLQSIKFEDRLFEKVKESIPLILISKRNGTFLLKYVCKCPSPHNTIRSGRKPDGKHPLDITCNVCGALFTLEGVCHDT